MNAHQLPLQERRAHHNSKSSLQSQLSQNTPHMNSTGVSNTSISTLVPSRNHTPNKPTDYNSQIYSEMPLGVAIWYAGLSKHDLPHPTIASLQQNESISFFTLRSTFAFAISNRQTLYQWGSIVDADQSPHRTLNFLQECPTIPSHFTGVRVIKVACNDSIAQILAQDGTLFCWGIDHLESGMLGLGEQIYESKNPVPNKYLLEYRIVNVSVGRTHVAAVDGNSQLFTWGTGTFGQLGQESLRKSAQPLINYQTKNLKLRHIHCSDNYTALITVGGYVYIFGSLKHYSFGHGHELEISTDSKLVHISGLSQSYITKLSGGQNYLVVISNKQDVFCVDEMFQVFRLSSKHKIASTSCLQNKIIGLTEDRLYMYEWKLPFLSKPILSPFSQVITHEETTKVYKLNPRYINDKSLLCVSPAQSKGVAAMTCRVTHNKEPLGIQLTSLLDKDFVSQDFAQFMERESSSEKKRKFKKAIEK